MFFLCSVLVCCFISTVSAQGASTGVVRLYRNGVADTSQSWSSGIVQIYYNSQWGNICDNSYFGSDEADVICHQLGYSGASSYSNTGTTTIWGSDSSPTVMDDVSCLYSSYLTITQCSFSTFISSYSCTSSNDVIVSCYSTRIWYSPSAGDVRLTGGTYSNQGLLEVYCNGEWGTVCDDNFFYTQARVACRQLGYNYYEDYDHLSQRGTSSQEIFLDSLSGCGSYDDCLTECGGCPSSGISSCSHYEDITLECRYSSSYSKVYTKRYDSCSYYDYSTNTGVIIAAIVGSIVGFIVCIIVVITVPICICVCFGVGIGAASRSSTRSQVVAYQPHSATTTAVVTQDTANTTAGYPTQPAAQPSAYYPADPNKPPEYQPSPPPATGYGPPPGYPPYQPTPVNFPQQGPLPGQEQIGYTSGPPAQ